MPTYQYTCTECGEQVEVVQKFTDDPLTVCTNCGGRLRKVFSPVGIVFKGSGFYRTDSRKGSSSDGPAKKDKEPAGSPSSDSSSGSSKDSGSSGSGSDSSFVLVLVFVWLGLGIRVGLVGLVLVLVRLGVRLRRGLRGFGQKGQQELGTGRLGRSRSLPCARESTPRRRESSFRGRQRRCPPAQPGPRRHRRDRRIRVLRVPGIRRRGQRGHPLRRAQRPDRDRRGGGPHGGVRAPARPRPPLPPAQDPLPGEPVGAALARRPPDPGPDRGGLAQPRARSRPAGHPRPDRGPDHRPQPDLLRGAGRGAHPVRRPLLPGRPGPGHPGRPRRGLGPGRLRDTRRDRRAAVLDPGRVAVVRGPGLVPDRDDRPPRGRPGPRAGPLLHGRRAGHRHRRRGGRRRGRHPGGGASGSSRATWPGCASWSSTSSRTCRPSGPAPAPTSWTASSSPSSSRSLAAGRRYLPGVSRGRRARSGPAAAAGPAGRTRAPRSRRSGSGRRRSP